MRWCVCVGLLLVVLFSQLRVVSGVTLPEQAAYAVATWLGKVGPKCTFATGQWRSQHSPQRPQHTPQPTKLTQGETDPWQGFDMASARRGQILHLDQRYETANEREGKVRQVGLGPTLANFDAVYFLTTEQDNKGSELHCQLTL